MDRSEPEPEAAPLPTRERQRHATRDRILRVALAEIGRRGLSQARIEHIARKAGVTRPTIYAHFPAKEDFLRALQARTEELALAELTERFGDADGPALAHRLADAIFDMVERAQPVLRREAFALMIREPQQMDWRGNVLFGFVSERFRAAQARGELPTTLPAAQLTRLVATAIFGFLVVENEPAPARRRAAHRLLELLLGAAASPRAPRRRAAKGRR